MDRTIGTLSLAKNFNGGVSLDELRQQVGQFAAQIEDYLNRQVSIYLVDSKGQNSKLARPTFKKGDLVFDFSRVPGVATLQQWNGKTLITFNLANFEGFINLITQGNGSGTNPTLFLRSDGAGGWVLDSPSKVDTADINANVDIPAFSLVTANGQIADSTNLFHFGHVVGLSTTLTLNGFIDTVVTEGEVTGPWTWTNNDKIFLNGTSLSTTPPTTGFSQFIAIARSNNTIYVRLQQPILL